MDPSVRFTGTRVLVLGDVMLDRYWWGRVSRISPEAPVPVVRLQDATLAAGGAANVAANIAGLGAIPVLFGIVGQDQEARLLKSELEKGMIDVRNLVEFQNRPTTVKTRIVAHSQQVVRIDQENDAELNADEENALLQAVLPAIEKVDAVVLSDYAKGVLTKKVVTSVVSAASKAGKMTMVDPKGTDYTKYRGASVLTPNRHEAAEACGLDENGLDNVEEAGNRLIHELDLKAVLITQGEAGMTLFRQDLHPIHLTASARNVYDVTGAGDTVIATLSAALGAGIDLEMASRLANIAAGLVVEQVGTTTIKAETLYKELNVASLSG